MVATNVIFIGLVIDAVIALGFTGICYAASNQRIDRFIIFLACLLFTPILGGMVAIIDVIANSNNCSSNSTPSVTSVGEPDFKPEGDLIWVEKGSKRIQVYENEKDFYLINGWTLVNM